MRGSLVVATLLLAGCGTTRSYPPRPHPSDMQAATVPATLAPDTTGHAPTQDGTATGRDLMDRLMQRTSWPSDADHARWEMLATRALSALDAGDDTTARAALFELQQLDDLIRVGEAARDRR